MDRLFDTAIVRPPSDSYSNCVSTNPDHDEIDVTLAKSQHRQYVSILKECGVRVMELAPLERFPDSVFMQDPAILGRTRSIVCRFSEVKRSGEEEVLTEELSRHCIQVGEIGNITPPGALEGGDVVVTERELFVGESSRTNSAGIQQLAARLPGINVKPVKIKLFHLLCGCSYLTNGQMVIAPELLDSDCFTGFRFITIPKEEAYACDSLYIGEWRVVIPSGFPKVALKLRQAGYKPVEVDMSEFRKGDGGVTCLSSPVYKVL